MNRTLLSSRRRGTVTILGAIALLSLCLTLTSAILSRASDSHRLARRAVARAQHQFAVDSVRAALQAGVLPAGPATIRLGLVEVVRAGDGSFVEIRPLAEGDAIAHLNARTYRIDPPDAAGSAAQLLPETP